MELSRDARPRRTLLSRILLGVAIVAAIALAATTAVVFVRRSRVERTRKLLQTLRSAGPELARFRDDFVKDGLCGHSTPWADEAQVMGDPDSISLAMTSSRTERHPALDPWGHPIRIQAPGPVHHGGWDMWSFGPDGVDDHGAGDDILIGEDLWHEPTPTELTHITLNALAARIRESNRRIRADGSSGDDTGLWALAHGLEGIHGSHKITISGSVSNRPGGYPDPFPFGSNETLEADDGWDRPVTYRCPGPLHPNGWDLWSSGPDGFDDHGRRDDLLVGEDFAPIISGG